MSAIYDQFRSQLLSANFGELRTRQKAEWMAKVSGHAYHDEMRKIASRCWRPTAERLLKKARLVAIGRQVEGRTTEQQSQLEGEKR